MKAILLDSVHFGQRTEVWRSHFLQWTHIPVLCHIQSFTINVARAGRDATARSCSNYSAVQMAKLLIGKVTEMRVNYLNQLPPCSLSLAIKHSLLVGYFAEYELLSTMSDHRTVLSFSCRHSLSPGSTIVNCCHYWVPYVTIPVCFSVVITIVNYYLLL